MDMWRSVFLKASMLVVMVLLCGSVLIVNAEVVLPLNWTSPTTLNLYDVFMVSASDGWAVGYAGTIIRWTGTVWIPEFPTAILMPLLMTLSLVVVIITKTVLKKRKTPFSFF